jgi:hypothetical protein
MLLLALVLISNHVAGQIREYNWKNDLKRTEGLDYLSSTHDAVVLFENHVIDFSHFHTNVTYYQVQKRMKILTELGLNQSAYVYIPLMENQTIDMLDACTIKEDGQVINMDASDIYQVDMTAGGEKTSEDEYVSYSKFAIPSVEVGDEIEVIYQLALSDYAGGDILPNSEAFSFVTQYNFILPPSVDFACQPKNGFPGPEVHHLSNGFKQAVFTIRNVKSIQDESYSIPFLTLPWFSYQVTSFDPNYDFNKTTDWQLFYMGMKMSLQNAQKSKKKHTQYYRQVLAEVTDAYDSPFEKFTGMYHYLCDSMDFKAEISPQEGGKSNEYFIYKGYMNRFILYRTVLQVLDDLQMNYHLCFARNRYRGPISIMNPRMEEVDEFLILINDEYLEPHFLCLNHPLINYQIDEIPSHLSGTKVAYIDESNDFQLDSIMLPDWATEATCMADFIEVNINPHQPDTSRLTVHSMYTGHATTLYRSLNQMMDTDTLMRKSFLEYRRYENPNVFVDTSELVSAQREFPFELKFDIQAGIAGAFDVINDSLLSIPLNNFIDHPTLETKTEERILDCYPEFRFMDSVAVSFVFPEEYQIEVINDKDLEFSISNQAGSYQLGLKQDGNKVELNSGYTITSKKIDAKEIGDIDQLNATYNRGKQNVLLIRYTPREEPLISELNQ